jgi:hypothetical protein
VSRLAACIVTSTVEPGRFASSATMVPANSVKRPFTVVIIMCLATNSIVLCDGSIVQVVRSPAIAVLVIGRSP